MYKRIFSVLMTTILLCTPLVVNAATSTHDHNFSNSNLKYEYTTQDGQYTHKYTYGYGPDGKPISGTCTVICETEYYTYVCTTPGCDETWGTATKSWDSHGACGLGDVEN